MRDGVTRRTRAPDCTSRVLPTGRGVCVVVAVPCIYAGGRLLGSTEMLTAAAAGAAVLAGALALVLAAPQTIRLDRRLKPDRVHAGKPVVARYTFSLDMPWMWPVRRISETLTRAGGDAQELEITGMSMNRTTEVDFGVLTRGAYMLGPARVVRTDPAGLFARRYRIGANTSKVELRVWPETTRIGAELITAAMAASGRPTRRVTGDGDEFRGLREMVVGDEPRRIHWPSTAKRGKFMIKQTQPDETPRAIVLLDCRAGVYPPEEDGRPRSRVTAFETAVSAAASVMLGLAELGWAVDIVQAAPSTPRFQLRDVGGLRAALDTLAVAEPVSAGPDVFSQAADAVRSSRPGTLILCAGVLDPASADALSRRLERFRPHILVLTAAGGDGGVDSAVVPAARSGQLVVRPDQPADIAAALATAAGISRRTRPAAAARHTSSRRPRIGRRTRSLR
jgi:uncharacterized protein (DUF58 family)